VTASTRTTVEILHRIIFLRCEILNVGTRYLAVLQPTWFRIRIFRALALPDRLHNRVRERLRRRRLRLGIR
jgi:hypothetical protein